MRLPVYRRKRTCSDYCAMSVSCQNRKLLTRDLGCKNLIGGNAVVRLQLKRWSDSVASPLWNCRTAKSGCANRTELVRREYRRSTISAESPPRAPASPDQIARTQPRRASLPQRGAQCRADSMPRLESSNRAEIARHMKRGRTWPLGFAQ